MTFQNLNSNSKNISKLAISNKLKMAKTYLILDSVAFCIETTTHTWYATAYCCTKTTNSTRCSIGATSSSWAKTSARNDAGSVTTRSRTRSSTLRSARGASTCDIGKSAAWLVRKRASFSSTEPIIRARSLNTSSMTSTTIWANCLKQHHTNKHTFKFKLFLENIFLYYLLYYTISFLFFLLDFFCFDLFILC